VIAINAQVDFTVLREIILTLLSALQKLIVPQVQAVLQCARLENTALLKLPHQSIVQLHTTDLKELTNILNAPTELTVN